MHSSFHETEFVCQDHSSLVLEEYTFVKKKLVRFHYFSKRFMCYLYNCAKRHCWNMAIWPKISIWVSSSRMLSCFAVIFNTEPGASIFLQKFHINITNIFIQMLCNKRSSLTHSDFLLRTENDFDTFNNYCVHHFCRLTSTG